MPKPSHTHCRRWGLRLAALALGLALPAAVEVALWLTGVGAPAAYAPRQLVQIVEDGQIAGEFEVPTDPHYVEEPGEDGRRWMRTGPGFRGEEGVAFHGPGIMRDVRFLPEPEPGVARYFLLGGSAALGLAPTTPAAPRWWTTTLAVVDPALEPERIQAELTRTPGGMNVLREEASITGQVRARLEAAGRRVEVINAAVVAQDSTDVVREARELLSLQPEGLLLYLGNNEELALEQLLREAERPVLTRVGGVLGRLRTYTLLRHALRPPAAAAPRRSGGPLWTVGEHVMAGWVAAGRPLLDDGRPADLAYQALVGRFRHNMEQVVREAGAGGVRVYLVPCAPHLTYQPMFMDMGETLDAAARDRSRALILGARQAAAAEDRDAALARARAAVEADPLRTEAWFVLGAALDAAGRRDEAIAALERSFDLDLVHSRTLPEYSRIAAELCADGRCAAADTHARMVAAARAQGLALYHRFWGDHEHLTPEGCAWVGAIFSELILAEPDPTAGGAR